MKESDLFENYDRSYNVMNLKVDQKVDKDRERNFKLSTLKEQ